MHTRHLDGCESPLACAACLYEVLRLHSAKPRAEVASSQIVASEIISSLAA